MAQWELQAHTAARLVGQTRSLIHHDPALAAIARSLHRCSFTPKTSSHVIIAADASRPTSATIGNTRYQNVGDRNVSNPTPVIADITPRARGRKVDRKIRYDLRSSSSPKKPKAIAAAWSLILRKS